MPSYAGTLENAKEINDWFIMDIGFSSSSKSCGVCIIEHGTQTSLTDLPYGSMLRKFGGFTKDKKKIGIIIEAPLSLAFQKSINPDKPTINSGSPIARKQIEIEDKTKYRYWYNGAGSMVTLATIHFLHEIKNLLTDKEVHFYEGFVSFKKSPEQEDEKPSHHHDAKALSEAITYLSNNPSKQFGSILGEDQNADLIFTGNYVGIVLENNTVPPVIKIADINYPEKTSTLHIASKP